MTDRTANPSRSARLVAGDTHSIPVSVGPTSGDGISASDEASVPNPKPAENSTADARLRRSTVEAIVPLQLGQTAPDFEQDSTEGPIRFHAWLGGAWAILFSHPQDYTSVYPDDLDVAQLSPKWQKSNLKRIGLAVAPFAPDEGRAGAAPRPPGFPILTDADRKVATLYGMSLPEGDPERLDRAVFVIDPNKTVRLILVYPPDAGRSFEEILRAIDQQVTDTVAMTIPVDWRRGGPLVVPSQPDRAAQATVPRRRKPPKPRLRLVEALT